MTRLRRASLSPHFAPARSASLQARASFARRESGAPPCHGIALALSLQCRPTQQHPQPLRHPSGFAARPFSASPVGRSLHLVAPARIPAFSREILVRFHSLPTRFPSTFVLGTSRSKPPLPVLQPCLFRFTEIARLHSLDDPLKRHRLVPAFAGTARANFSAAPFFGRSLAAWTATARLLLLA